MNMKQVVLGGLALIGVAVAGYLIANNSTSTESPATATIKSLDYLTPKNKVSVPSSTVAGSTSTSKVRALINPPGKQVSYNNGSVIATYNAAGVLIGTEPI